MPANTPALADATWALIHRDVVGPTGQSQYILYDGSLVHRIPWQRGTTYNDIYVGSAQSTSPEIWTCHYCLRRVSGRTIYERWCPWTPHRSKSRPNNGFPRDMVMKSKKETNKDNKQRFNRMLGQSLEYVGCQTPHANDDAAVLIVETSGHTAMSCESILACDKRDNYACAPVFSCQRRLLWSLLQTRYLIRNK